MVPCQGGTRRDAPSDAECDRDDTRSRIAGKGLEGHSAGVHLTLHQYHVGIFWATNGGLTRLGNLR